MKYSKVIFGSLMVAAVSAQSRNQIKSDGIWTGKDVHDEEAKINVINGLVEATDLSVERRIRAQRTTQNIDEYLEQRNVELVKSILTEQKFNDLYPYKNEFYSYDGFLKAVAKFPAFCGEDNRGKRSCTKELAAFLTYCAYSTNQFDAGFANYRDLSYGLYHIESTHCAGGDKGEEWCECATDALWPSVNGEQYYGRGPFQLTWDYNYGRLSTVLYEGYNSADVLLQDPDRVATDSYVSWASALFLYMNSLHYNEPSMHDIMTSYYDPNESEQAAGIKGGFGTTTNLLLGGPNCGWGQTQVADALQMWYKDSLSRLSDQTIDPATENVACVDENELPVQDVRSHFDMDWDNEGKCQLVGWDTQYPIYDVDAYKKCVCDAFGNGAEDCQSIAEVE